LFLATYVAADRVGNGGGVAGENEGISAIERPRQVRQAARRDIYCDRYVQAVMAPPLRILHCRGDNYLSQSVHQPMRFD
jgi:hypothetical protein